MNTKFVRIFNWYIVNLLQGTININMYTFDIHMCTFVCMVYVYERVTNLLFELSMRKLLNELLGLYNKTFHWSASLSIPDISSVAFLVTIPDRSSVADVYSLSQIQSWYTFQSWNVYSIQSRLYAWML